MILRGMSGFTLRGGKRALTPQAALGFNAGASTRLTAPNEFATHPASN